MSMQNTEQFFARRKAFWPKVHQTIVDIAFALYSFHLPPYVLLEIVDWLPGWCEIKRKKKIDLLIALKLSMDKLKLIDDEFESCVSEN